MTDQKIDKEIEKSELDVKLFLDRQNTCEHDEGFLPNGHEMVPNTADKQLMIVNIICCKLCGKTFIQPIGTGIGISSIPTPFSMPGGRPMR